MRKDLSSRSLTFIGASTANAWKDQRVSAKKEKLWVSCAYLDIALMQPRG
jgi:hypothetical protein